MTTATATHAVYARTVDGDRVRVTDAGDWTTIQARWSKLDDQRRARCFPHVRHFEVRSTVDPAYADAPMSLRHSEPLEPSRGFTRYEQAARRAWLIWQGETTPHGTTQGTGGWFYWHNGRTAAQGLHDLAALCHRRGLVVTGVDGRYYPDVSKL